LYTGHISGDLLSRRRGQLRITAPGYEDYAPSSTNCFAVARPMPLVPPVMSANFSFELTHLSLHSCFLPFYASVGRSLGHKLYELIYIRVSMLNRCHY